MLQHSRSSPGIKDPTNLNALVKEYLNLTYHGLKAKDKRFHASILTDFDKSIGKVSIIAQDIGRVLLNLLDNAFYAVNDKKHMASPMAIDEDKNYEPTVIVKTKLLSENSGKRILIIIKDNGMGIPKHVVDKIFQPFFTTKPAGEGTGLGLSLSYDIIKSHGGELTVNSTEGEGTEFSINLAV